MDQLIGEDEAVAPLSGSVAGLAQMITEVYGHADDTLLHAVQDSFHAGMPSSVLTEDLAASRGL